MFNQTAIVQVAEQFNLQAPTTTHTPVSQGLKVRTNELLVDALENSLGFGFWNLEFPDQSQIPRVWAARVSCSKPPAR
jgi:hypothetical protein